MHSSHYDSCKIHHNGDYEGECIINGVDADDDSKQVSVRVNFDDLKSFVLDYYKNQFIEMIETTHVDSMPPTDLFNLLSILNKNKERNEA